MGEGDDDGRTHSTLLCPGLFIYRMRQLTVLKSRCCTFHSGTLLHTSTILLQYQDYISYHKGKNNERLSISFSPPSNPCISSNPNPSSSFLCSSSFFALLLLISSHGQAASIRDPYGDGSEQLVVPTVVSLFYITVPSLMVAFLRITTMPDLM